MRASLAERRRNERERASSLDVPRKFSISQRRERRESARASTSSSACSGGEAERRREAWKAGDVRVGAPNDMGEGGRGGEGGWEERERGRQREWEGAGEALSSTECEGRKRRDSNEQRGGAAGKGYRIGGEGRVEKNGLVQ